MADYQDMLTQLRTELANIHTREEQLVTAIQNLERLTGQGPVKIDPKNPTPFKDLTYGEAAQQLLTKHGPMPTRDLAQAMLEGGIRTKSRNFVASLYSLLYKDGRFRLGEDRKWHLKGGKGNR